MKSSAHGKNTLEAEVTHISVHGIWVNVFDHEYFLSFKEYPWFQEASVAKIHNLEFINGHHLHWPDLDVDLEIESLNTPEKFPNVYKN